MKQLYSHRSQLVLGFHGCDANLAEQVVLGKTMLKKSDHDYDWLGPGIYFWENNVDRAEQWAKENWEGGELYPGSGFREKNHIQIAIINPNCIKGFFLPREVDAKYIIP